MSKGRICLQQIIADVHIITYCFPVFLIVSQYTEYVHDVYLYTYICIYILVIDIYIYIIRDYVDRITSISILLLRV